MIIKPTNSKNLRKIGQTAIEYLLLLCLVAGVVLASFNALVPRAQVASGQFYNKAAESIMGAPPVIPCMADGTCSATPPTSCGLINSGFDNCGRICQIASKPCCAPVGCLAGDCGLKDDGCGTQINCGPCCMPVGCLPGECGLIPDDGCGNPIDCGPCCLIPSCLPGECGMKFNPCTGANDIDCGICCSPSGCLPSECGLKDNGCGVQINCGTCCAPVGCLTGECGTKDDGCGTIIDCGACIPPGCGATPVFTNATVQLGGSNHGDTRDVICDPGYVGTSVTIICDAGTWVGAGPSCLSPNDCAGGSIQIGIGVTGIFPPTRHGDTVTFVCPAGFTGSPWMLCMFGSWQTLIGACDPIPSSCSAGVVPIGSGILGAVPVTIHNDTVSFNCPTGYTGSPTVRCNNGTWEVVLGACDLIPAECPAFVVSLAGGGTVTFPSTPSGQTVTMTCPAGYLGSLSSNCFSGSWNPILGACDISFADCPVWVIDLGGGKTLTFPSTPPGNTVTVNCPIGFSGAMSSTCSFGVWGSILGGCNIAFPNCLSFLVPIGGGNQATFPDTPSGQTAIIFCPSGFSGQLTNICFAGAWGITLGSCAPIIPGSCSGFTVTLSGGETVTFPNAIDGQTLTAPCPPNYSGTLSNTCSLGSWGPMVGACTPLPIDGGWCWNLWGDCSAGCGLPGTQTRTVIGCNCPTPSNGGAFCSGPSTETQACIGLCSAPVDGGWCWSNWSTCSAGCGGTGTQTRTATGCGCPAPANGGASCSGATSETQSCSTPPCTCTGPVPSNANICSGDDIGLMVDTPYSVVMTCGAPKCEYTCKPGFIPDGATCRLPGCVGPIPGNATICSGDDIGVAVDTPRVIVGFCGPVKCEYLCNSGFVPSGTSCRIPQCTGVIPSNSNLCPGDDLGLPFDSRNILVGACGPAKCEYTCKAGFTFNGASCN